MFESTGQRVCDLARIIRNNGQLPELELEAIKRQAEGESQGELYREQDVTVDAGIVETAVGTVEEEINDAENSIGDTEGDLSEEHQAIVEQLKKIIVEGRTGDDIMLKETDKKVLKVQTDRVNEAIRYLKSKSLKKNNQFNQGGKWLGGRTDMIEESTTQEEK